MNRLYPLVQVGVHIILRSKKMRICNIGIESIRRCIYNNKNLVSFFDLEKFYITISFYLCTGEIKDE
jgi:hypothetical protein